MVMEVFRRHGVKAGQGLEVNVMLRTILDSSGFDKVTGLNEVVSAGLLKLIFDSLRACQKAKSFSC